jgi:tRNA (guanine-N7-)-methyltransferase
VSYTPKFVSILAQRQAVLRAELDKILSPPETHFVWEVGCGHGHFLTAYAAAHPHRTCIGIDLVGERIERALKKRNRAKLPNLHFLQAEARLFLETLPGHARLSTVFVLFPDPWPKLRHNKHRIIQPGFLAAAAARAAPDCPLYFRTDFAPYFAAARDVFTTDPSWQIAAEPWPFEFETVFQQRAETFESLVARCKTHPVGTNSSVACENAG